MGSAYQAARQFTKERAESVEGNSVPAIMGAGLISISPNPSPDNITVRYSVANAMPVELEIVSPLGVPIASLVDVAQHRPGEFTASFDGSSLARGVYYCVLRCNGNVQAQQFVLY